MSLLTQSGMPVRLGGHTPHKNGAFYPATSDCRSSVIAFGHTQPIGGRPGFPRELRLPELLQLWGGHDAWGADLPRKAPAIAPAAPIALSWTGFYVGVHAGYSWGRWDGDLTFDPGTGPIVVFDPSHRKIDANGWLAGGQIEFNYQVNSFVFGLEADASWTNLKGSGSFNTIPGDVNWAIENRLDWFGTVRGRVGFAVNNFLFYGTGGVALGKPKGTKL